MIGVVLWSDPGARKAVIWCEDHGDLAFYAAASDAALGRGTLDAGDLVEFDMTTDKSLRYAHNPQVVSENLYPHLAGRLDAIACPAPQTRRPPVQDRRIVPFRPRAEVPRHTELEPSLSVGG